MKKNKIILFLVLTILIIILFLSTIFYLYNIKENVENININIIEENILVDTIWNSIQIAQMKKNEKTYVEDNYNMTMKFTENTVNICFDLEEDNSCDTAKYTQNNDTYVIEKDDNLRLYGNITISDDQEQLVLEKEIDSNTIIRYYFAKPLG